MLRRDYLIRKIEDFGRALARLKGLLNEKNYDDFEREAEDIAGRFTNTQLEKTEKLSLNDFHSQVVEADVLSREEKKMLAHLMFEKLNFYLQIHKSEEAEALVEKCELIYFWLAEQSEEEYDLDVHYKRGYLQSVRDQLK